MTASVILTAMGSDRPGLTQALAAAVREAGGNWLESHLARLGGRYVGAVLVEIAPGDLPALDAAVRAIDPAMLSVSMTEAIAVPPPAGTLLAVELVGADRPGIVSEVTAVLAGLGANIETIETSAAAGAWSGERLFRAAIALRVPGDQDEDSVRAALEAISGEIMVDLTVAAPGG